MSLIEPETSNNNLALNFVEFVINKSKTDKGLAAALRRADNPDTEYQSWETLARFNINLEKPWERLPFALVAAAIAKAKPGKNGEADLGAALKGSYEADSTQAQTKLRRLLACQSVEELCRVLRPTLALVHSKSNQTLDFARLLNQVKRFYWQPDQVKAQWAQSFYHKSIPLNPGEP